MNIILEDYIEIKNGIQLPNIKLKNSVGYFYIDNDFVFNKSFYEELKSNLDLSKYCFIDYILFTLKNNKEILHFDYSDYKGVQEFILDDMKKSNKDIYNKFFDIYSGSEYLLFPDDLSFIIISEKGLEVAVLSVINSSILNKVKKCNFILSTKEVKEKFHFLKIFDSAQNRFFNNYPSCF